MYKIFNWNKFDKNDPECIKALGLSVGRFIAKNHSFATPYDNILFPTDEEKQKIQNFRAGMQKIQNLSTTADFPEFLNDLLAKFIDKPISDVGYQAIFNIQSLQGTDGWDVYTVDSDFEFPLIPSGDKQLYYTMSGAKYRSYVDYYGGGLSIDQKLLNSRNFVRVEDGIINAVATIKKKEAQVAYALIEAIGAGQNTAWQNPDPAALANTDATYTANRDAQTLCSAAESLITDNKDKGVMPDGLRTVFFVLHPYQLQKRLQKANSLRLQSFESSHREISTYDFTFISTTLLSAADKYYVGIAKGKNTGGMLLNLTQFTQFNQVNYTNEIANWEAFGFDIGDEEQIRRCSIA